MQRLLLARHCVAAAKPSVVALRALSLWAHLNDLGPSALCAELKLRGYFDCGVDDDPEELRDRLRAEAPGYIPEVWPRSVRTLAPELGLDTNSAGSGLRAVPVVRTYVARGALGPLVRAAREPLLVSAACPGNPVRGWPALGAWQPAPKFFERFGGEALALRQASEVATQGGMGARRFRGTDGAEQYRSLNRQIPNLAAAAKRFLPDGAGSTAARGGRPPPVSAPLAGDGDGDHGPGPMLGFSTMRDDLYWAVRRDDVPLGALEEEEEAAVPAASGVGGDGDLEVAEKAAAAAAAFSEQAMDSVHDSGSKAATAASSTFSSPAVGAVSSAPHSSASSSGVGGEASASASASASAGCDPSDELALRELSMHPVLSVSGEGGGLAFHRHDKSWLALLAGRKLWCFAPPGEPPRSAHHRALADTLLGDPALR